MQLGVLDLSVKMKTCIGEKGGWRSWGYIWCKQISFDFFSSVNPHLWRQLYEVDLSSAGVSNPKLQKANRCIVELCLPMDLLSAQISILRRATPTWPLLRTPIYRGTKIHPPPSACAHCSNTAFPPLPPAVPSPTSGGPWPHLLSLADCSWRWRRRRSWHTPLG